MVSALIWNNSKAFKEYADRKCNLRKSHACDSEVTVSFLLSLPTQYLMPPLTETGGRKVTILRVSWSSLIRGYELYEIAPHGFSRN